jgi:hypothetical protein
MKEYRDHGMSATLKAHIFEHHVIAKMKELGGLGDKDESFVELLHQYDTSNERRLNSVTSYEAKHNIINKVTRNHKEAQNTRTKPATKEKMNVQRFSKH